MKVLYFADTHAPFEHPDALDFLRDCKRKLKPDAVVCCGDMIDNHALGRWEHDPDGRSIGDELKLARRFVRALQNIFPKLACTTSNHTDRFRRTAFSAGLPSACIRPLREILGAPIGWSWQDEVVTDGVTAFHGDGKGLGYSNPYLKAAENEARSCVMGHFHTHQGVAYNKRKTGPRIFGACTGCLIDKHSYAMAYRKNSSKDLLLGALFVVDGKIVIPQVL